MTVPESFFADSTAVTANLRRKTLAPYASLRDRDLDRLLRLEAEHEDALVVGAARVGAVGALRLQRHPVADAHVAALVAEAVDVRVLQEPVLPVDGDVEAAARAETVHLALGP